MSRQRNLLDTGNVTSSPGSVVGPTPSDLRGGPTTGRCGPAPALASLSPRQAGERGLLTSGTYGRTGTISSGSAALQSYLVSRLRANLPYPGLTLFAMTWRQRVTPSGRLIYRLAASGRRTSGSGCGSWVSPTAQDHSRGTALPRPWDTGVPLSQQVAQLSSWPTPMSAPISEASHGQSSGQYRKKMVECAPWPTPSAQGSAGGGSARIWSGGARSG